METAKRMTSDKMVEQIAGHQKLQDLSPFTTNRKKGIAQRQTKTQIFINKPQDNFSPHQKVTHCHHDIAEKLHLA
jgi:hypothetical protein